MKNSYKKVRFPNARTLAALLFLTFSFASFNSLAQCPAAHDISSGAVSQTVCDGDAIADIEFLTTNDLTFSPPPTITGVGSAGLNVTIIAPPFGGGTSRILIFGTPTASGAFTVSYDDAACTPTTQTVSGAVTVNLPTATITGTATVCKDGTAPDITFTGSGGTPPYTFGYTINSGFPLTVSTAAASNTVTVSVPTGTTGIFDYDLVNVTESSAQACTQGQSGTATVTVNALPTATITGTATVCKDGTAPDITFTGSGGTPPYTFGYTINSGFPLTVSTAAASNTVTVSVPTGTTGIFDYDLLNVTESSAQACTQGQSGTATVTVNALPTATITGTATVCKDGTAPDITFTGSGGTPPYTFGYTINSGFPLTVSTAAASNTVTVSVPTGTTGIFDYDLVNVTESSAQACTQGQSGTATVTVNALPSTPTVSFPAGGSQICQGEDAVFEISNVTIGDVIDYDISGGGANATTTGVTVTAVPFVVTISNPQKHQRLRVLKIDDGTCDRTWPNNNTAPNYRVRYREPVINGATAVCVDETINLTIAPNATTGGYTWLNLGTAFATLTPNDHNDADLEGVSSGIANIVYTNSVGCDDTMAVTINPKPTINISPTAPTICLTESVSFTASGPVTSYQWDNTAASTTPTMQETPLSAGAHTFTVTGTDAIGCTNTASETVTVNPLPTMGFTALADVCENAGVQTLGGATPSTGGTGVYSGTGVTDNGNNTDFNFDPLVAGVGIHTIKFIFTDGTTTCTDSIETTIEVVTPPTAAFAALADVCINAGLQPALGGGTPTTGATGVYSGTGVTDNGNGTDFDFNPATAGVGTHDITYIYTDPTTSCKDSAISTIKVTDTTDVSAFAAPADLCYNGGTQTLVEPNSLTGGTFSGAGVSGTDFDPLVAGVGTHTITYTYTNADNCISTATDDVEVFDTADVSAFAAPADLCYNGGTQTLVEPNSLTGGTFSGAGVSGTDFDPLVAGVGTHTITYTYTNADNCISTATDDVEVFDTADVSAFAAPADLCYNGGTQTLVEPNSLTGGTFSGAGVSGTDFDPLVAGVGTHTITYTYTNADNCISTATDDVEVFDTADVSAFAAPADLCYNGGTQTLVEPNSLTGGTFSGAGVSGTDFDPLVAGVGTHTITYTYTNADNCISTATDDVEVFDTADVSAFAAPADLCYNGGTQTLVEPNSLTGGTFSGAGVSGTDFDPLVAGVGTHTITYTYTNADNCISTATDDVEVFDTADVSAFAAPADLCINALAVTMTEPNSLTGGTFSGAGVSGTDFDPLVAGVGTHTITYTYTNADNCTSTATDDVEVFAQPVITASVLPAIICFGESVTTTAQAISGAAPVNISWSHNQGNPATVTPALPNNINYTASASDANGCSATPVVVSVTVHPLPVVAFAALADVCINAGEQTALGGAAPNTGGTGVYSGPGVTDNVNNTDFKFNPATAGVGTHNIKFIFTDGATGCTDSATTTIVVVDTGDVSAFAAPADLCYNGGTQTLVEPNSLTGGTFSGAGVSGTDFDPLVAGVGTHTITYTYTASGCISTAMDDVEVFDTADVSAFAAPADLCYNGGTQTLVEPNSLTGGTFSGAGVSGTDFDPLVAGVGTHTITYTYTNADNCISTATDDVEVFDTADVSAFAAPADLCYNGGTQTLVEPNSLTGGTFSGAGVSGTDFDPLVAGVGTHTITYTYTNADNCISTATDDVEVFDTADVSAFAAPADLCYNGGTQTLVEPNSLTGGTFSGAGVSGTDFDPLVAGVGTHTITYTYTNADNCISTATDDVEVFDTADVSAFAAPADLCYNGGTQTLVEPNSLTGGTFSGAGVSGTDFDPLVAGVGTHTITYTYTNADNCISTATDDVEVFDTADVSAFAAPADLCYNGGTQTLVEPNSLTGGTFSGAGVSGTDFDPLVAGVGTHTITYTYTNADNCISTATDDVEVFDTADVSAFAAPADLCYNGGTQTLVEPNSLTGGTFSGAGVSGTDFDPLVAGVGTHTITYTYTNADNCISTATDDVEVFDTADVSAFAAPADLCINAGMKVLVEPNSLTGGTFSGPGVTGNIFDPTVAGVGTHTITYTYTNTNNCTSTTTDEVEVFAQPAISASITPSEICFGDSVVTTAIKISGAGTLNYFWSHNQGNGGTVSPPTPFNTNYTVYATDANACSSTPVVVGVIVNPAPAVTFTPTTTILCENAGVETGITGGSSSVTTGVGIYSGSGVTDQSGSFDFDPVAAGGPGTYTIKYLFVTTKGCTDSATATIDVIASPVAAFAALSNVCENAGVQTLSGGTPNIGTIGVYSGPGVTDNGNGQDFDFDAVAAGGAGTYTIKYLYSAGNGCADSATTMITVDPAPVVAFSAQADVCENSGLQSTLTGGTPTTGGTGVYSGPGVTDNGTDFDFDPTGLSGLQTITYKFTTTAGCTDSATTTIDVKPTPVVTFANPANVCENGGVQSALTGGAPTTGGTGVYSGPGVTDNGTDFDFDPTAAGGAGTYTLKYVFTTTDGCMDSATAMIVVDQKPVVMFAALSNVCENGGVQSALTGGTPTTGGTGVYSGPGVTDNGTDFDFDPMAAGGVGTYVIKYVFTTTSGCKDSATAMITVDSKPTVAFAALANVCENGGVQSALTGGTPTTGGTGVYSGPGVTDNGTDFDFDPIAAGGAGTYTLKYVFAAINGCIDSATTTIVVDQAPVITSTVSEVCVNDSIVLTASNAPATTNPWMSSDQTIATIDANGKINGLIAGNVTITYTDANGCQITTNVDVNGLPLVTATASPTEICLGDSSTLTASSATAINFFWNHTLPNSSKLSPVANTNYTVYGTDAKGCSSTPVVVLVQVNNLPALTTQNDAVCLGSPATLLAFGASTPPTTGTVNYAWTGPNSNSSLTNAMSVSPTTYADSGTYTVTATDIKGCESTATATLTIHDLPVINGATTICVNGTTTLSTTSTPAGTNPWMSSDMNVATVDANGLVTALSGGSTTITFTDINGCSSTLVITANSLPVLSGNDTICADGTTAISATGTPHATTPWASSDMTVATVDMTGVVTALAAGTTTITFNDASGCSADTIVTVNPLPAVTASSTASTVCAGDMVTLTGNGASTYTWDNSVIDGTAFAPTATTTYTVTGSDANGCSAMSTVTITVNPLPSVTANTTATVVCAGDMVTLTGGGAMTYAWDNSVTDGTAFAPTATTIYTVTGTDANGCSATSMVMVTVNPLPAVTANASSTSVCTGDMVTFTGGGAATYVWDNSVTDGTPIAVSATTTYMVTGTDANGCSATSTVMVTTSTAPAAPTVSTTDPACVSLNGTINISAPFGSSLEYSIDGMVYQGSPNFSAAPGTYNVTVRDNSNSGCVSAATSTTINATTVPCGPNVTVGALSSPSSIAEGGTANIDYFVVNSGTAATTGSPINILITKPSNGTLTLTPPTGWTITVNTAGSVFLQSTAIIQPGLINRVTIPAVYVHDNTNEDAVKTSNIKAAAGSGGEVITNDNEGQTFIQIN